MSLRHEAVASSTALAVVSLLALLAPAPSAAAEVRRFALVVGANQGAPDRLRLRYAVRDAERFAAVLTSMGGVSQADALTLREPGRQALLDGLALLRGRTAQAAESGQHTEVLFYFSGHADESGLLLGRERLAYAELREALAEMPSDVGIAVLDACASGAITRLKGGRLHPAFLSDESARVRGRAFLTSSSEGEAAQESDQLQGSFFTHALVTGLRGAADASADGKVTLGEAYRFAFDETLSRTAATQGGVQHPTYDIRMAGTGDVVLTDVRETAASLVLGPELDGRIYVWDAQRRLFAELSKPAGRTLELAVEPGDYELSYQQQAALLRTRLTVAPGERRAVSRDGMTTAKRLPTRIRGPYVGPRLPRHSLASRSRIEVLLGSSGVRIASVGPEEEVDIRGGAFDVVLSHWPSSQLALELSFGGSDLGSTTRQRPDGTEVRTQGLLHGLAGARYYPPLDSAIRPHLGLAIGPVTELEVLESENLTDVSQSNTRAGLRLGAGVDAMVSKGFMLGLRTHLLLRRHSSREFGVSFALGWSFGTGPGAGD